MTPNKHIIPVYSDDYEIGDYLTKILEAKIKGREADIDYFTVWSVNISIFH